MRDNREYKTGGNIDMAKIGFIGMGNMGTAIMRGLLKTYKPEELLFTSAHEAKMQKSYGGDRCCPCLNSN